MLWRPPSLMHSGVGVVPQEYFDMVLRLGTSAEAVVTLPNMTGLNVGADNLILTKNRDISANWNFSHPSYPTQAIAHTNAAMTSNSELVKSRQSNGYTLGITGVINISGNNFIDYVFKGAPNFFKSAAPVGPIAVNTSVTVDLSTLGTVGMVLARRIQTTAAAATTGDWFVWHKDLGNTKNLRLDALAATSAIVPLSVSGTTLTIKDDASTTADGYWIVFAWADNPGLVRCGKYVGNGAVNPITGLGFSPRLLISKGDAALGWGVRDSMRVSGASESSLLLNTSGAEQAMSDAMSFDSDGFTMLGTSSNGSGVDFYYLAVA